MVKLKTKRRKKMSDIGKIVEEVGRTAYELERIYHGCSQCVLKALQDHLDLGDGLTFKAASALAGGVGRMGDACGSLLGGIMAIGLAFGREKLEVTTDSPAYQKAQEFAGELCDRFIKEFGSIVCRDIQKSIFGRSFDLRKPEEREAFLKAGGYDKCPEVAKRAASMAAEIIIRGRPGKKRDHS